jgi:hypothetical protein
MLVRLVFQFVCLKFIEIKYFPSYINGHIQLIYRPAFQQPALQVQLPVPLVKFIDSN